MLHCRDSAFEKVWKRFFLSNFSGDGDFGEYRWADGLVPRKGEILFLKIRLGGMLLEFSLPAVSGELLVCRSLGGTAKEERSFS